MSTTPAAARRITVTIGIHDHRHIETGTHSYRTRSGQAVKISAPHPARCMVLRAS